MAETENPKKPEKYIQLVESDFKGSRAKAKRSKPREVVYTLPEPEIRPTRPEGPKATEAIVKQVLRSIVAECSDPDRFSRASLLEKDKYPSECLDLLEEQDRERWPARGVPQSKIVGLVVEGLWQRGFREPWADNGAGWEYIRPMLEKGGFAEYVTGEGAKYKRCNDIIDWDPAWRWVGAACKIVPSPDFRSVNWGGQLFTFTPTQARVVELLFNAYQSGAPELSHKYILSQVKQIAGVRLVDTFRKCKAWRTMIVGGAQKDTVRLADPSPREIQR